MSVLAVDGLGISFGGLRAVDGVSLAVERGEIFSIIGPNGAGKTTLFNLISGIYRASEGRVRLGDRDVTGLPPEALARLGLSRTFQNLQVFFRMTVLENVMLGRHVHERTPLWRHLLGVGVGAENRLSAAKARELLARVRLLDAADRPAGSLSYGALKRLEIARALAAEPQVLLLDEPAAGCNATETAEIDRLIEETAHGGIAVVLVEHDMKLVMSISHRVHVLTQGRTLVEGTPAAVARDPRVIEAYLGGAPAGTATAEPSHA